MGFIFCFELIFTYRYIKLESKNINKFLLRLEILFFVFFFLMGYNNKNKNKIINPEIYFKYLKKIKIKKQNKLNLMVDCVYY